MPPSRISTHAPLAGRDQQQPLAYTQTQISTHAPLAGRDLCLSFPSMCCVNFNPRAPCGARPSRSAFRGAETDFNPRAPCGARPSGLQRPQPRPAEISTHAPLAGRDYLPCRPPGTASDFNPRAPCGARRIRCNTGCFRPLISTHAPLAGRDANHERLPVSGLHFNPRAPCGARQSMGLSCRTLKNFNPRAPCGARLQVAGNRWRQS